MIPFSLLCPFANLESHIIKFSSLTNWKCILRSIRHHHHDNYQHLLHLQSVNSEQFDSFHFFHLCSSSLFGIHPCHFKIDIPSLNMARFWEILFDSKMDLLLKNVSDDIVRIRYLMGGGHSRGLAKNIKHWGVVNIYCKTHSRYYLRFCVLVWSALSATNPQEQFFSVVFLQPRHLFQFGHSSDKDKLSASPLNLKNDAHFAQTS